MKDADGLFLFLCRWAVSKTITCRSDWRRPQCAWDLQGTSASKPHAKGKQWNPHFTIDCVTTLRLSRQLRAIKNKIPLHANLNFESRKKKWSGCRNDKPSNGNACMILVKRQPFLEGQLCCDAASLLKALDCRYYQERYPSSGQTNQNIKQKKPNCEIKKKKNQLREQSCVVAYRI